MSGASKEVDGPDSGMEEAEAALNSDEEFVHCPGARPGQGQALFGWP